MMPDSSALNALHVAIASHYDQYALEEWRQLVSDSAKASEFIPGSDAQGDGENVVENNHKLNWLTVSKLATTHGLGPLLYAATKSIPAPEDLPPPLVELKSLYQETAAHNMLAMHDLAAALHCLHEAGVQVMLLKGAALLNGVYENLALRPMFDSDILIQFSELDSALASLASLDYSPVEPEPFANLDGLFWNELLLRSEGSARTQLELHWNLLDIPYYATRLPVSTLMRRALPVTVGDHEVMCLSPLDLLLHLCAHNIFHHQGLLWRTEVDVAFVVQTYHSDMDWDQLVSIAVENDLVMGVQQTLLRAATLWRAPVPQPVLDTVAMLRPKPKERVWLSCQRSGFLKVFRTFATLPDAKHRYHFAKGQLFPTREYLSIRYGIPLETSRPLAYSKRFWSGMQRLVSELLGSHV